MRHCWDTCQSRDSSPNDSGRWSMYCAGQGMLSYRGPMKDPLCSWHWGPDMHRCQRVVETLYQGFEWKFKIMGITERGKFGMWTGSGVDSEWINNAWKLPFYLFTRHVVAWIAIGKFTRICTKSRSTYSIQYRYSTWSAWLLSMLPTLQWDSSCDKLSLLRSLCGGSPVINGRLMLMKGSSLGQYLHLIDERKNWCPDNLLSGASWSTLIVIHSPRNSPPCLAQ